jgi:hypothetical protein
VIRLEKADLPCFPYMGLFVTDATFAWDGKVRWLFMSFWHHADGFVAGREAFEISSKLH